MKFIFSILHAAALGAVLWYYGIYYNTYCYWVIMIVAIVPDGFYLDIF